MKKILFLSACVLAIAITVFLATCQNSLNNEEDKPKVYTTEISFDANGGTGGPAASYTVTATYNKAMPELEGVTAPTHSDSTLNFWGYYDAKNGGKQYYYHDLKPISGKWDKKDEAFTLQASWGKGTGESCVITFNNEHGTGGPTTVTATNGQVMPTITAAVPTRTDHEFLGYYDEAENGVQYYKADLTSSVIWDKDGATATLYAQWKMLVMANLDPGSIVSLVRAPSTITQASEFDDASIKALVEQAIEAAGGWDELFEGKTGATVVLKPNIIVTYYNWGSGPTSIPALVNGVTTDRRVVKAVSELVRAKIGPSGKILVMEGSGSGVTKTNYTNMGYNATNLPEVDEIIAIENDDLGTNNDNMTRYTAVPATIPVGITKVELGEGNYKLGVAGNGNLSAEASTMYKNDGVYYVNKRMKEADIFISIPVLKSHGDVAVTGSIKNISIGASPARFYGGGVMNQNNNVGRNNRIPHASSGGAGNSVPMHCWIADYYTALPADYVVMDGLQGLDNGPLPSAGNEAALKGFQKNMRVMLASKDALALDTVGTNIMNWDFETIKYLDYLTNDPAYAAARADGRVGNGNPENITVLGNIKVDDIRNYFGGNPASGGSRIPGLGTGTDNNQQPAKPTVSITSAAISGSDLVLVLDVSDSTVKVDIYAGDTFLRSVNENLSSILSIDASGIAAGSQIKVYAYTKYMAFAEAAATL